MAFAASEVAIGCMRLRLILDQRITPEVIDEEWGSGHERVEEPASLELVGCDGRLLNRLGLASPLARLDAAPVRGAPYPTYLVTADLTREAGSYNGPLTIPVEVVGNRLQEATALHADSSNEPMRLTTTLKSAWRKVANSQADEFLFASSQLSDRNFVTSYRRYYVCRKQWRVKVRTEDGLWESDGDFPSRVRFPH